jgi:hypothetical protein
VHGDRADLFARYDAIATPFAVLVDPAGRVIRSEPVGSRTALRRLLDELARWPGRGTMPVGNHGASGGTQ